MDVRHEPHGEDVRRHPLREGRRGRLRVGRPEAHITTVLDTARLRPLRERAYALHASQTSPLEGMPDELRDAVLERDHLVRLNPPWSGGPQETSLF